MNFVKHLGGDILKMSFTNTMTVKLKCLFDFSDRF